MIIRYLWSINVNVNEYDESMSMFDELIGERRCFIGASLSWHYPFGIGINP